MSLGPDKDMHLEVIYIVYAFRGDAFRGV